MSWNQFFIFLAVISLVTVLSVTLTTWWHIRSTRRSLERFRRNLQEEFEALGAEIDRFSPELFNELDRLDEQLERIGEKLDNVNANLEISSQYEDPCDEANDEWEDFYEFEDFDQTKNYNPSNPSQN
jgi:predicted PurR-regulated permease PerM